MAKGGVHESRPYVVACNGDSRYEFSCFKRARSAAKKLSKQQKCIASVIDLYANEIILYRWGRHMRF